MIINCLPTKWQKPIYIYIVIIYNKKLCNEHTDFILCIFIVQLINFKMQTWTGYLTINTPCVSLVFWHYDNLCQTANIRGRNSCTTFIVSWKICGIHVVMNNHFKFAHNQFLRALCRFGVKCFMTKRTYGFSVIRILVNLLIWLLSVICSYILRHHHQKRPVLINGIRVQHIIRYTAV